MDKKLNSGGGRVGSRCENTDPDAVGVFVIEEEKDVTSAEDVSPTGIKTELSAAEPGEADVFASKKAGPPTGIKCDICLCEMSSDLVLPSHVNGSRHKKKIKALEIVANLRAAGEKGFGLESDNGSNIYRCDICSLTVNSPQQLETHLSGAKHRNKVARKKLLNIVINVTAQNNQAETVSNDESPPSKKRKKDMKGLFCDICNRMLNSETQYEEHIVSRKHLGRAMGENKRKKKGNRLQKNPKFTGRNRFPANKEPERDNSQNDTPTQQFQPRTHQAQSPQNNRTNVDFNLMNRGGVTNDPPFGNYFQPRPFNNRNFGNNFETGKFFSKTRPHLFNSHPDSVLQSSSSKL